MIECLLFGFEVVCLVVTYEFNQCYMGIATHTSGKNPLVAAWDALLGCTTRLCNEAPPSLWPKLEYIIR